MLYFIIGYILGFILGIVLVADWIRRQIIGGMSIDIVEGNVRLRLSDYPKANQKYAIFKLENTQKNLSP